MLRRPKHSTIEVVTPKKEEEVCFTTGPSPFPKQVLHRVQSSLPLSLSRVLVSPSGHPVAAYVFFFSSHPFYLSFNTMF
jgi:hypothetical protein